MQILALEFSSVRRSVAVLTPSSEGVASSEDRSEITGAFALIEEALSKARLDRSGIDCIVIGLGPGSYTGIRVAISIAQGWQLARDIKLLGLSSADALAEQARENHRTGTITCIIDAQRTQFYVGTYNLESNPATMMEPLHIENAAQILERVRRGEALVGPHKAAPHTELLFPEARALAGLAARRTDFLRGEQLEPIYLRETSFVKAPPARFSSAAA